MNQQIFSIGHSNKPSEELVKLLKKFNIQTLIDVRSKPYSKYNPQFNRETLRRQLHQSGIVYEWRGNNLGGLEFNINWDGSIQELCKRASKGEVIAVMCSEGKPINCHRQSKIQPAIEAHGTEFAHILWDGTIAPAPVKKPEQLGLV